MLLSSRNIIRLSQPRQRINLFRHLSSNESKTKAKESSVVERPPDPTANSVVVTQKNSVERYSDKLRALDSHTVWGVTEPLPDPVLPEDPKEIAALDTAQECDYRMKDRVATIRQNFSSVTQSPKMQEQKWCISFQEGDTSAKRWTNSLMGWTSSSDTMSNNSLMVEFNTAKEAVYFAKKRGWNYIVERPIVRHTRNDGALYQDNFLPQRIAKLVKRDGVKCDHWKRPKSMASHYFRPLKYHGDGFVNQYGPNPTQEIAPNVKPVQKMR